MDERVTANGSSRRSLPFCNVRPDCATEGPVYRKTEEKSRRKYAGRLRVQGRRAEDTAKVGKRDLLCPRRDEALSTKSELLRSFAPSKDVFNSRTKGTVNMTQWMRNGQTGRPPFRLIGALRKWRPEIDQQFPIDFRPTRIVPNRNTELRADLYSRGIVGSGVQGRPFLALCE